MRASEAAPAADRRLHLLETNLHQVPELAPLFPHLMGAPLRPAAEVADARAPGGARRAEPVNESDVRDLLAFFGMREAAEVGGREARLAWPEPRSKPPNQKVMCAWTQPGRTPPRRALTNAHRCHLPEAALGSV